MTKTRKSEFLLKGFSIQPRFNNLSMRIEVLKGSIESELKAREQPTFGIAEKIAEPSVKLMKQTDLTKI